MWNGMTQFIVFTWNARNDVPTPNKYCKQSTEAINWKPTPGTAPGIQERYHTFFSAYFDKLETSLQKYNIRDQCRLGLWPAFRFCSVLYFVPGSYFCWPKIWEGLKHILSTRKHCVYYYRRTKGRQQDTPNWIYVNVVLWEWWWWRVLCMHQGLDTEYETVVIWDTFSYFRQGTSWFSKKQRVV